MAEDFSKFGQPDIVADVTFLTAEEGGEDRQYPSGIMPHHLVLSDYLAGGRHQYLTGDYAYPGETTRANIWFIAPEAYPK